MKVIKNAQVQLIDGQYGHLANVGADSVIGNYLDLLPDRLDVAGGGTVIPSNVCF